MSWTPLEEVISLLSVSQSGGIAGKLWRKETLLLGLLGLIVVGAVVITIVSVSSPPSTGNQIPRRYFCQKCKQEFTIMPRDIPAAKRRAEATQGPQAIDCPKCGAKDSALAMVQCLNQKCGKWFVPQNVPSGRPGSPATQVCPYCGLDQFRYLAEHPQK